VGALGGGREVVTETDLLVLCLPGRRGIGHGERHAEHAEATEGGKRERGRDESRRRSFVSLKAPAIINAPLP
jgi:hypothetical protein